MQLVRIDVDASTPPETRQTISDVVSYAMTARANMP